LLLDCRERIFTALKERCPPRQNSKVGNVSKQKRTSVEGVEAGDLCRNMFPCTYPVF